ncbi:MAG: serine/threonine protein kinase [Myxococcaceae bacterium]|nr:serine/threonine protein kinase [Myxococcaceae bacterium]
MRSVTRDDPNRHLRFEGPPLAADEPVEEVVPGDEVGRYRVVERIGAGGMAEVFRATYDGRFGDKKQVVLKLVLPELAESADYAGMFLDEGRLTASLSHPNLPVAYELGLHGGRNYLAMEWVDGVPLRKIVSRARERNTRLPLDATLKLMGQLLECLSYVHTLRDAQGAPLRIVHRDVSPSNLLVTDSGALKLLDFGIAKARMHEHVTQAGHVKGKMGYMSPEQSRGLTVDLRTDIYAAGTLLYLLVTGVGPFEHLSEAHAVLQACATGYFPKPREVDPTLDPELERIIMRALALEAGDRYPTADAMLAELEVFALYARLMPSTRALAAAMRELFPERVKPAKEPRVRRSSRHALPIPVLTPAPVMTVTDEELASSQGPSASMLTEPATVGMADAAPGGDDDQELTPPLGTPAVGGAPTVPLSWVVAAALLAAFLVTLVGIIALNRPSKVEVAPQLEEFSSPK